MSKGRAWLALAIIAAAEFLGMSPWLAATAVGPQFASRWALGSQEMGWLTTAVQVGFVTGTAGAAILNLPDITSGRRYFSVSAVGVAAANAALLLAPTLYVALALRFLTGLFLAGVYPPAMKMAATWFLDRRGLAIGTVVGALTVGTATPYLIKGVGGASLVQVLAATSAAPLVAAVIVAVGYRDGPHAFPQRPFRWSLAATVVRDRQTIAAIGGYCGHMLELYAVWAWIPAYIAASMGAAAAGGTVALAAFVAIGSGAAGCVVGGAIADRIGKAEWTIVSMAVSGTCCVLAALAFGGPLLPTLAFVSVWGFFVVADSAQFSAIITEVAPPHAVGTALTIQTSIGFALTAITIQGTAWAAGAVGWRWAFPILAMGPALGIAAMARLSRPRLRLLARP